MREAGRFASPLAACRRGLPLQMVLSVVRREENSRAALAAICNDAVHSQAHFDLSRLDSLLARPDVRVHLVGCGGAGMRALAEFARDLGWEVSGSDAGVSSRTLKKL